MIENVFARKSEQDSRFNILLESIRELFQKEVSDYFIMSFSENKNSRLLWDSYARKNGYCIKFSSTLITDLAYSTPLVKKCFVEISLLMNLLVRKNIKKAQDSLVGYSYDILANKVLYDSKDKMIY